MTLKAGALFAGYGGLEPGISQVLDIQTTWVAEVEAGPTKILTERFPDAPNLGDVTKIDWASVEPVDIISGGSPCQDLSHAGKRAGMKAGTRSGLWVCTRATPRRNLTHPDRIDALWRWTVVP